jgi:hypothetical protein
MLFKLNKLIFKIITYVGRVCTKLLKPTSKIQVADGEDVYLWFYLQICIQILVILRALSPVNPFLHTAPCIVFEKLCRKMLFC